MPLHSWIKISDEAIKEGMLFVSLSGGECFLYPHFRELYKHLYKKGVLIYLLTNGVLLESMMDLFLKMPPALIQISLYGANEENYFALTGKKVYKIVCSAINQCVQNNLRISISITPSKFMKDTIDIVKLCKKIGISFNINSWLTAPNENTGRNLKDFDLSPVESAHLKLLIREANGIPTPVPYTGKLPDSNFGRNSKENEYHGLLCTAGRNNFSIDWEGKMHLCTSLPTPVGEPLKEGFSLVWKKAQIMADEYVMPVECFDCAYEHVCTHCPARHLANAPIGHCNKNVCQEARELVKLGFCDCQNK